MSLFIRIGDIVEKNLNVESICPWFYQCRQQSGIVADAEAIVLADMVLRHDIVKPPIPYDLMISFGEIHDLGDTCFVR